MPVAIVNEAFAAKLGGNVAAIGQQFSRERTPRNPEKTYEIVGVVRNSSYMSVTEQAGPSPLIQTAREPAGRTRNSSFARTFPHRPQHLRLPLRLAIPIGTLT